MASSRITPDLNKHSFITDEKSVGNLEKFHFVLDIDDTLATGFNCNREDLNKRFFALEWFKQRDLVIDAYWLHILHPGAVEFVKWLITKFPGSSLSFMSKGDEERNKLLVAEIIKKAFPEKYADIIKNISIFSRQHIVKHDGTPQQSIFNGNMKKDLRLVLKPTETINNVVLIDDDPTYTTHGQEKNLLRFTCRSIFEKIDEDLMNKNDFFNANHIFYIVGLLNDAVSKTKESLADTLFELQCESSSSEIEYKPMHKQYYLDGLKELKKVSKDSNFGFYGNELSIDYYFQLKSKEFYNSIESLSFHAKTQNIEKVKEIFCLTKTKSNSWKDDFIVEDIVRDAIYLNHIEIVELFLKEGVRASEWAHSRGNRGAVKPLIWFAAKKGNLKMVKILVEHGATIAQDRIEFIVGADDAIEAAVQGGFEDITEYLLERGATAEGRIGRGRAFNGICPISYLGKAALDGNIGIVSMLAKHGANVKDALKLNYARMQDRIEKYYDESKCDYKESYIKKLTDKKDNAINRQLPSTQILMDHAIGDNFSENDNDDIYNENIKDNMNLFKNIDVSGVNFIGVTLDGNPVTHEILKRKGIIGAEKAITTLDELKDTIKNTKNTEESIRLQTLYGRIKRFKQSETLINKVCPIKMLKYRSMFANFNISLPYACLNIIADYDSAEKKLEFRT